MYSSDDKLLIDVSSISVERQDFAKSVRKLVPASYRVKAAVALPIPKSLKPLLAKHLLHLEKFLEFEFPFRELQESTKAKEDAMHGNHVSLVTGTHSLLQPYRPRLLISSSAENGIISGGVFSSCSQCRAIRTRVRSLE